MRAFRLTLASWQMLQRLSQPGAELQFGQNDGRFHFYLHGARLDLVRPTTIDALNAAGMIRRGRATTPTYAISEKGAHALQERLPRTELLDDELPMMRNITVVSPQING